MAVSDKKRIANTTTTIEAIGTSAQAGPRSRRNNGKLGSGFGAATTPAWSTSRPASEGMNGRATQAGYVALPSSCSSCARSSPGSWSPKRA